MTQGEFYEKVTFALILCDGWMTSGPRGVVHNADVEGVWDSLHQVGFAIDCKLQAKDNTIRGYHYVHMRPQSGVLGEKTMGELFTRMCERMGLLVIDEGDHFHVQPKGY